MIDRTTWSDKKLFFHLLNKKSSKTYWDDIHILRKRATKEIFNQSIKLTKSKKAKKREIGIDILAQLSNKPRTFYKESVKLFFKLLKNEKNTKVLTSLLYAIGHNNDKLKKSQINIICLFINSNKKSIQEALVFSLLGIENKKAIKTLIILSKSNTNDVRNWATFGIGTQTERDTKYIREALWNRINDRHEETKFEAIVGLAKRKDIRIKKIIKRELHQKEFGSLLFEAISELQENSFLPLLKKIYKKEHNNTKTSIEWIHDLKRCITSLKEIKA